MTDTSDKSEIICQSCQKSLCYAESLFLKGYAWCYQCFKKIFSDREDVMKQYLLWKIKNKAPTSPKSTPGEAAK